MTAARSLILMSFKNCQLKKSIWAQNYEQDFNLKIQGLQVQTRLKKRRFIFTNFFQRSKILIWLPKDNFRGKNHFFFFSNEEYVELYDTN